MGRGWFNKRLRGEPRKQHEKIMFHIPWLPERLLCKILPPALARIPPGVGRPAGQIVNETVFGVLR